MFKIPIISTNCKSGPKEILGNGKFGDLVKIDDYTSLSDLIIKNLKYFENFTRDEVYDHRKAKFLKIGRDQGFNKPTNLSDISLGYKMSLTNKIRGAFNKNKYLYFSFVLLLLALIGIFSVVK